jgi:hypothetical protein
MAGSDDDASFDSDFGELEQSYEMDEQGNPIDAPKIAGAKPVSVKAAKEEDKMTLDDKRKKK